jgi:hypothetical protein
MSCRVVCRGCLQEVFVVLGKVFKELASLFPDSVFHQGADEVLDPAENHFAHIKCWEASYYNCYHQTHSNGHAPVHHFLLLLLPPPPPPLLLLLLLPPPPPPLLLLLLPLPLLPPLLLLLRLPPLPPPLPPPPPPLPLLPPLPLRRIGACLAS